MNLTLAPIDVSPSLILEKAALFEGQPFTLDGHFATHRGGQLLSHLDCLRYPFFVWRECGLWPDEWVDLLPYGFRTIRFGDGNRLRGYADFPLLGTFLQLNFEEIEVADKQPGDLLGFRWPNRETVHHCGFAGEGNDLWHVAYRGAVCRLEMDALWQSRLEDAWRLKPVSQRNL